LLTPQRADASRRERKEKTAYKKRLGADTLAELCPLDPTMIGLELVSTSTLLSIASQDIINNRLSQIKTFLTTNYEETSAIHVSKCSVFEIIAIKTGGSEILYAPRHTIMSKINTVVTVKHK